MSLQAFIAQSVSTGECRLPPGRYEFNEPITLSTNVTRLIGAGDNRTILVYTGAGSPIQVTAQRQVVLERFGLECQSANATDGITVGYRGPDVTTGWQYELKHLRIRGFPGAGIHYTNCELTETTACYVDTCGIGYWADNTTHPSTAPEKPKGISNVWMRNRAFRCNSYGWLIDWQSASAFICNQGLQCSGPAQFFLVGHSDRCLLWALDLEHLDSTTVGLQVSGVGHQVQVNAVKLALGIKGETVTDSFFYNSKFSPQGMPRVTFNNSSGNTGQTS